MMISLNSKQIKLSELVEMPIQTGYQVRGKVEHDPDGNFSVIQVKNINRNTYNVDTAPLEKILIAEDKQKFMDKYLLQKNDVLYLSKLNPGSFRYHGPLGNIVPMAHFYMLRPIDKSIDGDYLCWALNQDFMKPYIAKSLKGTTLPFISKQDLMDFVIPVPDINTQRKIVEISSLRRRERELTLALEQKKDILINELLSRHL